MKCICKRCSTLVTNNLNHSFITLSDFDCGDEIITEGFYTMGYADISINHNGRILINRNDSKLIPSKKIDIFFGCCGYHDAIDLNQLCPNCGLAIATIVTECWTYHYIAIDTNTIKITQ